jgi:hypothetical protein
VKPRYHLLVALLAIATLGGECTKPDWVKRLEHSVDVAVPQIEAALDKLAADLPAAVAKLDAVAGRRLAELDSTLRDAVDGLAYVLAHQRDHLDAALAARVQQLAAMAQKLAYDVHAVALGLSTRITATTTELLAATRAAATSLLVRLDAQIARIESESGRVVANVYSEVDDMIVRIVGVILLVLGLIGGALVLILRIGRRRAIAFAIQLAAIGTVTLAGSLLLLSGTVRRWFVHVEPVVIDHTECPTALSTGVTYIGRYRAGVTPAAVAEASTIVPPIASCLVMAGSPDLFDRAGQRLAEIRRMLGIEHPCISSTACRAGTTCDVATGACIEACTRSSDCQAGAVCHESERACGPPCTTTCPGGATCSGGICKPGAYAATALEIRGGRGWNRVETCAGDPACLAIVRGPAKAVLRRSPVPP